MACCATAHTSARTSVAVLSVLALATLLRFLLRPNDTSNRMRGTQSTCKLARSGTRRLQGEIHAESSRTRTCRAQHRQSFLFHRVKSLCLRTGIASTRKTNATKNFCSSYKTILAMNLLQLLHRLSSPRVFLVATAKLSSTLTLQLL